MWNIIKCITNIKYYILYSTNRMKSKYNLKIKYYNHEKIEQ